MQRPECEGHLTFPRYDVETSIRTTAAWGVAMLLSVVTLFGWARSYQVVDCLAWDRLGSATQPRTFRYIESVNGRLDFFSRYDGWPGRLVYRRFGVSNDSRRVLRVRSSWGFLGFERWNTMSGMGKWITGRVISIPYWFCCCISSLPMAVLYRRRPRRQTARHGVCKTCGYDLRATPERCPECGTITPATRT